MSYDAKAYPTYELQQLLVDESMGEALVQAASNVIELNRGSTDKYLTHIDRLS